VASGLRQRVTTALLLGALIVVILLWLPPVVAVTTVMIVVAAGAWEWGGFLGLDGAGARFGYVAAIALGVVLTWSLTDTEPALGLFLWLTLAWWLLALVWLVLAPAWGGRGARALAGFAVLVPAAVGIGKLVAMEPRGQALLLFLLVLIAAADVGAYFGGRALGKRKLAPRVSPNKTWEGLLSGMLASVAAALAGGLLFREPLGRWLLVCLVVALVSVVGDLVESMFKRQVGLKDSSGLLPGHGGVLDRVDSLTAAGPVFLLGLLAFGVPG
jgi:phosphatidate cytidylyltransferase